MKTPKRKKAIRRAEEVAALREDSMLDEWTPRWVVADDGYEWMTRGKQRWLGPILGPEAILGREATVYNPLKAPELQVSFREFVNLKPSEDAFLAFATRFGHLGVDPDGAGKIVWERWEDWLEAHRRMKDAVAQWDRSADERATQKAINKALQAHARVRVLWSTRREKYAIRVLPVTLLGCMWWQFAMAFTNELPPGVCAYCGQPLMRGPGRTGYRKSARFCSVGCRVKNHRKKTTTKKSTTTKKGK